MVAQWRAAWRLLPLDWRQAVAHFCLMTDDDLYELVFH